MFVVESGSSLGRMTLIRSKDVHLDMATYNCPWLNTGVCKSTPTNFTDCPIDLLMVRAYANWTGNWRLVIRKGISEEDGVKDIFGMNTKLPNFSPVKIWASIMRVLHLETINVVPLHSPSLGAIFLNNVIGQPTFNSTLKAGSPGV